MAKRKKARTPAPPRRPAAPRTSGDGAGRASAASPARPVQAPKVRSTKRRTQADTERRNRIILYSVAGAGLIGLVVAALVVFVFKSSTPAAHFDGPNVDFANLRGLIKTAPPWKNNTATLRQRLKPSGLTPLGQEGQVLHIHEHLDIYMNGKHVTVPQFIGIKLKSDGNLDFITELHTHSTDGVIHLESPTAQSYSLGQFFGAWGVNLSRNCVGDLCSPAEPFAIYVNGKRITGDPVRLVLQAHQEIAIVYGTPPKNIPSSYNFPNGE